MDAILHVLRRLVAVSVALAVSLGSAYAEDYFLTIGGGPTATNNQVSLEKNVLYIQRILAAADVPQSHQIYLFADGTDPGRDLHEIDPHLVSALPHALLARLTGNTRHFEFKFRSNEIPHLRGPATRANVVASLQELASRTKAGDRVFIYLTGHGGRGKPTSNGRFYLWHNASMTVREFVAELDRFKPEVKVICVMVQCYSGSFANIIFEGGDPKKPTAPHARVGFFATVETRPAAGCTPDIEEENYREYSSYYWAALFGSTRTGKGLEMPDYDGDGVVSLDEAHAFVLIEGDTIDIPVKTSEAYLRRFSPRNREGAVSLDQPYEELLELADPVDRVVLEKLSEQFKLTGSDRVQQAKQLSARLQKQRQQLLQEASRQSRAARTHARTIYGAVVAKFPELRNAWRPDAHELLRTKGEEVTKFIQSQAAFQAFQSAHAKAESLRAEALEKERQWARLQRFLRVLEDVVLEANLRKFCEEKVVARYDRIRALEHEPFLKFGSNAAGQPHAGTDHAPGHPHTTSAGGCR